MSVYIFTKSIKILNSPQTVSKNTFLRKTDQFGTKKPNATKLVHVYQNVVSIDNAENEQMRPTN